MLWYILSLEIVTFKNFCILSYQEESQLRSQEEEAKRKELSEKFQTTINDISEQMQENFKANQQLKTENNEWVIWRLKITFKNQPWSIQIKAKKVSLINVLSLPTNISTENISSAFNFNVV